MITKEYTVLSPEGLHARPAKEFIKLIKGYASKVTVRKGNVECDAKSMLGLLSLEVTYNSRITVEIDGDDEGALAGALDQFFSQDIMDM